VYSALEPQLPEVVARLRDYVPLLTDAHSTVAGMAQRELFRADDAGQLEIGIFLDAGRAAFLRAEKKLVRAGPLLIALAKADGPVQTATLEAFAYPLNARDQHDRAAAVDALLVLTARGQLDGAALGRRIGELAVTTELMALGRIVPCLRDLARSGAAAQTWDALAALLPPLISHLVERPGMESPTSSGSASNWPNSCTRVLTFPIWPMWQPGAGRAES
jgi:hypothetical protein